MHPFSREKNRGTILHAVPQSTAFAAALLIDQRDTPRQSSKHVSTTKHKSTSSRASSSSPRGGKSSCSSSNDKSKSPLIAKSAKGAIGVYKHGKIQWRSREDSTSEGKHAQGTYRDSKPKIKVVIPSSLDRPLPALPFFACPNRNHIVTASIEHDQTHDVSPPSAHNRGTVRYSIVSPLSQTQNMQFSQLRRSMNRLGRRASVRQPKKYQNLSISSNSSHDSNDSDTASDYSEHSSSSSIDDEYRSVGTRTKGRNHAHHISILNPVLAGVFDSSPADYSKDLIPPSTSPPRRYDGHAIAIRDFATQPASSPQPLRKKSGQLLCRSTVKSRPSRSNTGRRSLKFAHGAIDKSIDRSTSRQLSHPSRGASPTLSEAEYELEQHLTSFIGGCKTRSPDLMLTAVSEQCPFQWDEMIGTRNTITSPEEPKTASATVPVVPPIIPRKSSRRQAVLNSYRLGAQGGQPTASMNRGRSMRMQQRLTVTIPEYKRLTETFELSPIEVPAKPTRRNITPTCAEGVILGIFRSLENLGDLFATAVLNRGFYRVFKRHELDLIKGTLRRTAPAAWEFREIAFPGHDMLHDEDLEMTRPSEEYTPSTYLRLQKRDVQVIRLIKLLIKDKCQSFVRPEVSIALISANTVDAARVDDALWRIWTFCKIFGSGKGREDDIVAQQDWLKGGIMAHQPACTFSIMSTDYMNNTLVGALECFAEGNEGGLTAEQLFDMMELWNCLGVLLQGFAGRTDQARQYGIYDCTDVRGGDIDGEEAMLDEWCYHLLTMGLSTILELAAASTEDLKSSAFKLARQNGWTEWKPPVLGGTRRHFLKKAATRIYEDKIAVTYATTTREIRRQMSKQRVQRHTSELKDRRNNGPRLPIISMSQKRPMSEWSTVMVNLTRGRAEKDDIVSHIPSYYSSGHTLAPPPIPELPSSRTPPPPSTQVSWSPRRVIAQPLLPSPPASTVPSIYESNSVAASMPGVQEHPALRYPAPAVSRLATHPAFRTRLYDQQGPTSLASPTWHHDGQNSDPMSQHPTQYDIYASPRHENTAEKAIYRIVDMGFTAEQAREALRMTDLGDGLRVDRAVELLLNRQE